MNISSVATPALVVNQQRFEHNVATMSKRRPGAELRPHVKAFKSTALARKLVAVGHKGFCCATVREMAGMAEAGLGDDLLLANECVDPVRLAQLVEVAERTSSRITVAIDSPETIAAAAKSGMKEILIDVYVGLPRCGCPLDDVEALAEIATKSGLTIRGVMGYEGHLVHVHDLGERTERVAAEMEALTAAHKLVGGDVVSGGGTGTYDINDAVTEVQAGSYTLMDGEYGAMELPFLPAVEVVTTVISVNRSGGWVVLDAGLKALAMDQGPPTSSVGDVLYCSDEHTVVIPPPDSAVAVGERVSLYPVHLDPTVAKHSKMIVADDDGEIVDEWLVDLGGWDLT